MSQEQLAKKLEISYQQVQDYERGKVEPRAERLEQLAGALETNTEFLLDRWNYSKPLGPLHHKLIDAYERGNQKRILDLLRQQLLEKGIGKKPISRKKPPLT